MGFCARTVLAYLLTVIVSDDIAEELKRLPERNKLLCFKNIQDHYKSAAEHLILKSALKNCVVKYLRFLKPDKIKTKTSEKMIKYLLQDHIKIEALPILDEWRLLQLEDLPKYDEHNMNIDTYWDQLFQNCQRGPFKKLEQFVKMCLSISHGNAEVERGFSKSKLLLDENQAAMSVRTLNAKLNVSSGLKLYNNRPERVPITRDLLKMSRLAYQSYNNYLQEQKELEENKKKQQEQYELQEEIKKQREMEMQQKTQEFATIKSLVEKQIKEKNETETSTNELLEQVSQKLDLALKKENVHGLQVAQGLLHGALSLREKEQTLDKNIRVAEKRKNSLISEYFCKKPKPN